MANGPDLTYVNSSNGKIFINGIIVDDCYDIQYSYKEMKEPLYGYNSKYWDAMVPGSVIIHGSFTINYKHDGYLKAILDMSGSSTDIESALALIEDSKNFNKKYREALIAFTNLKQDIKDAENAQKQAQAAKDIHDVVIKQAEAKKAIDTQAQIDAVKNAKTLEANALNVSIADKAKLNSDIAAYDAVAQMANEEQQKGLTKIQELNDRLSSLTDQMNDLVKQQYTNNIKISVLQDNIKIGAIKDTEGYVQIAELEKSNRDLEYRENNLDETIKSLKEDISMYQDQYAEMSQNAEDTMSDIIDSNPQVDVAVKARTNRQKAEVTQATTLKGIDKNFKSLTEQNVKLATDLTKAKQKVTDLTSAKNQKLSEITKLKAQLDNITPNLNKLKDQDIATTSPYDRAEDNEGTFNIFINYNGLTHKILEECILTGHSHVIQQGGEAIKEYYSFIAKKIR